MTMTTTHTDTIRELRALAARLEADKELLWQTIRAHLYDTDAAADFGALWDRYGRRCDDLATVQRTIALVERGQEGTPA